MNLEQFKNIDKYTVTNLTNAIDNAIDVSFSQMIDTVRTQCYMSQKQDSWEDCKELEFLEDIPMLFTDGRDIKESIKNQMKRVVISALTDSDWVGKNDAMYQHLPTDSGNEEDVLVGCQTVGIKEDGWTRKSIVKETNDSENSVIILALETLLEQVRDARDFEQIARVKNLLDSRK